jgi:hypothetical protein
MNINIKSPEIVALVDALFANKRAGSPVVTDQTDLDRAFALIVALTGAAPTDVHAPEVSDDPSRWRFTIPFGDAHTWLECIPSCYVSRICEEDEMLLWTTVWFDDSRKFVIEFDGYLYSRAFLHFTL